MDTNPAPEIRELSVAERTQLVEDIWDNIAADPERLPLPAEQAPELDRRLDDAESPAVAISPATVNFVCTSRVLPSAA